MFTLTKPRLAVNTIARINALLEQDQGNLYRNYLREAMPLAEDAYRQETNSERTHLGASQIGRDCVRELWYIFRWATTKRAHGRLLRLFNRGHLEEPRFVALLRMIGCKVWQHDEKGNQFRITGADGHFGGSLDAVLRGCPDFDPNVAILGEFKTHGDKSFTKLVKEGVRSSKYEHFIQMQLYMDGYKLPAALYLAVNKNDDELYGEIIYYEKEQVDKYRQRAQLVVLATEAPPKVSDSPGWWKCRFCDFQKVCHYNEKPQMNCRTCQYSSPTGGGTWTCSLYKNVLTKSDQLKGCPDYIGIPM